MSLIVRDRKLPGRKREPSEAGPRPPILEFQDVNFRYVTKNRSIWIVRNQSFTIPRGTKLGILGAAGTGKSTLMSLITGIDRPSRGRVFRGGNMSWPVGSHKGLNMRLTPRENSKFIARLYGVDEEEYLDQVLEFSEMGRDFTRVLRSVRGKSRVQFAYAVCLLLDFDCYLVDDSFAPGNDEFKEKCETLFRKRLETSDMIMATRDPKKILELCNRAAILDRGRLTFYDDVNEAIANFSPPGDLAADYPAIEDEERRDEENASDSEDI